MTHTKKKILQGNVNHAAGAQDLFIHYTAEWGIDLGVIAEPYRIPDKTYWLGDLDNSVVLINPQIQEKMPLTHINKGRVG